MDFWNLTTSLPNKERGNVLACDYAGFVSVVHARTVSAAFHQWWAEIPPRPQMPPRKRSADIPDELIGGA